jgi:signal transduction histidine kinase
MPSHPARVAPATAHTRHTVADWLAASSLSRRLSWLVVLIVTTVVTGVAYLEEQSFVRSVERDLINTTRSTAQAVAEDLAARQIPLDPLDIRDTLHDFAAADPVVNAISFVEADESGHIQVIASTSTEERSEAMELARRVIATSASAADRTETIATYVVPVPSRLQQAVIVTVGLDSLQSARARGTWIAFGLALPTVLLVTMLVHLTIRRLVHRPIALILHTMESAARGDLRARALIGSQDEFGTIAAGLNDMLGRLEHFNEALQERVREATTDLSVRNAQLAKSYSQMLALREALAESERMAALGQMAANVAHQAGTPLNLISGYVQMLRDDPQTDGRTHARLQTIDAQIHQVIRVLRTMLDHARRPSGFEVASFADIVERVHDVAAPQLSRSDIRLRVSIPGDLPPLRADATQLEMALMNLVTNALDAMPKGGALSITASMKEDAVRLEVADTGPGISSSIIDSIFEPWVTTKPPGQGTGLGLAIVRDVVRNHGGTVSVQNGPHGGAVFVIELPCAQPSGERTPNRDAHTRG